MRLLPCVLFTVTVIASVAAKTHEDFRAEAVAAYERKDFAAARDATREALALRPDSPRYLHSLAALSALLEEPDAALTYLQRLADLGVSTPIERDPDLASLQGTPAFRRIVSAFSANRAPQGDAEVIAEFPGRTGIIEGIAFRPKTGERFLGDVHHRCIWRQNRDGELVRFSAEDDEMLGVFGLAIDESRNTLWAAMSAVPEMSGFTPDLKGHAALAEFNLATSELRRVVAVPVDGRDHGLNDLAIGGDGTVYVSDGKSPVIWMLVPDAEELQKVVDSSVFGSLQGLIIEQRTLLAADYVNGLFAIDLPTGNITALPPPANVTLVGLDGLVAVPGGLIAIQNGVDPQRVLHVKLTPAFDAVTQVAVLAAALPNLTDLGLVTLDNGNVTLVAGAGWSGLDSVRVLSPLPHTVRVFQVALP